MFNFLFDYGEQADARRRAEVWLPSDTAPTVVNLPPQEEKDTERWENDGGRVS